MKSIERYFDSEFNKEMYEAIRYFLLSQEIREGKFEGNEVLINKLNRNDVIVYKEYELQDGSFEHTADAQICKIENLIDILDKLAEQKGLTIPKGLV
jgi:hypothetical protein